MSPRIGRLPIERKKGNIAPIHNKGDKQTIENHRPVSLQPICGEIFERLLYDTFFNFFSKNNLLWERSQMTSTSFWTFFLPPPPFCQPASTLITPPVDVNFTSTTPLRPV